MAGIHFICSEQSSPSQANQYTGAYLENLLQQAGRQVQSKILDGGTVSIFAMDSNVLLWQAMYGMGLVGTAVVATQCVVGSNLIITEKHVPVCNERVVLL